MEKEEEISDIHQENIIIKLKKANNISEYVKKQKQKLSKNKISGLKSLINLSTSSFQKKEHLVEILEIEKDGKKSIKPIIKNVGDYDIEDFLLGQVDFLISTLEDNNFIEKISPEFKESTLSLEEISVINGLFEIKINNDKLIQSELEKKFLKVENFMAKRDQAYNPLAFKLAYFYLFQEDHIIYSEDGLDYEKLISEFNINYNFEKKPITTIETKEISETIETKKNTDLKKILFPTIDIVGTIPATTPLLFEGSYLVEQGKRKTWTLNHVKSCFGNNLSLIKYVNNLYEKNSFLEYDDTVPLSLPFNGQNYIYALSSDFTLKEKSLENRIKNLLFSVKSEIEVISRHFPDVFGEIIESRSEISLSSLENISENESNTIFKTLFGTFYLNSFLSFLESEKYFNNDIKKIQRAHTTLDFYINKRIETNQGVKNLFYVDLETLDGIKSNFFSGILNQHYFEEMSSEDYTTIFSH